jgi:DNA repair protein RadD
MIELYPEQNKLALSIGDAMRRHASVIAYGPTGFGKTVLASWIAERVAAKGNTAIFCVHRDNLIRQTVQTFREFNIDFGYIVAGVQPDRRKQVHVASIHTLARRLETVPAPSLLVIDEAHLAAAKTWERVVSHYRDQGSKILGLSGSPTRLDGKPLSNLFDVMVSGPSVRWLIDQGFLSEYVAYCPSQIDLTGVKTSMGDFQKDELAEAMDKPSITGDAISHYRKLAYGTRAVCYCVSIKHSEHVCAQFNADGIPAAHICGETPRDKQRQIIRDFADGKYMVLCNVELITTGFDLSAQVGRDVPIETIIGLRPTSSLALHLQMLGRGLRRKPKPAVLLDHAGNCLRLGLPDDDREWSLEGKPKSKKKTDNDIQPIRQCTQCYAVHRPAPACPHCGFEYPKQSREVEEVSGELKQIDPSELAARRELKAQQAHARSLADLVALGRARGYAQPNVWASHVWLARVKRGAA